VADVHLVPVVLRTVTAGLKDAVNNQYESKVSRGWQKSAVERMGLGTAAFKSRHLFRAVDADDTRAAKYAVGAGTEAESFCFQERAPFQIQYIVLPRKSRLGRAAAARPRVASGGA